MREAAPAFIHASDVYVACGKIAGDLHVADEVGHSARHDRAAPRGTVITGEGDEDVCVGLTKVVPRNVHSPEKRRAWVIVGPARLAIVFGVDINAKMSPAIRVLRSGGLVPAQRAAVSVRPHRKPGAGRLVVQNNWAAKCIREWALTASGGQAGKCVATIG